MNDGILGIKIIVINKKANIRVYVYEILRDS